MTGKDRYTGDQQQLKANYSNNQCIIEKSEKERGIKGVKTKKGRGINGVNEKNR